MPAARDIIGQRFGRLVAVRCVGSDRHGKRVWLFSCDCGRTHEATASTVLSGKTQSCGCLRSESAAENSRRGAHKISAANRKHGLSQADLSEYGIWNMMRQRCNNPRNKDYPAYGGRGIRVCERWNDFAAFLEDMGARPSRRHSIDRRDTNGDYEPGNCRWADDFEQAANRRKRGTGEYATQRRI